MAPTTAAFIHPLRAGPLGQRFLLHRAPQTGQPRGLIVYVHPFAEEMNKSRRMAALQAMALAREGWAVLQVDLLGCGDSAGDFGDAGWDLWVDDVVGACRWLQQRHVGASAPLWLWGLRSGCLLAAAAAERLGEPVNFLFWQPATSGKRLLQQFLRLKVAGEMLGGGASGVMDSLRRALAAGDSVEVAGYRVGAALANGLDRATLQPATQCSRVEWIDVSSRDDAALSPDATTTIERWRAAGHTVRAQVVAGPAFWQTTEIEQAPALLEASTAALDEPVRAATAAHPGACALA